MILKYKVPLPYRDMFKNKKIIYCEILEKAEKVYLVKMLNGDNLKNVFADNELKRLNLFDRIKILKYRKENKK